MPDELQQAEQLKRLIVEPVVNELKTEINALLRPISDEQAAQKARLAAAEGNISTLQSKWGKALVGFTIWSTIAGLILAAALTKIKKFFGI